MPTECRSYHDVDAISLFEPLCILIITTSKLICLLRESRINVPTVLTASTATEHASSPSNDPFLFASLHKNSCAGGTSISMVRLSKFAWWGLLVGSLSLTRGDRVKELLASMSTRQKVCTSEV